MIKELLEVRGLKTGVNLDRYTTWKIGGKARYFWEPNANDLADVIKFCYNKKIKVGYIGRGSNILVDDSGFDGLIICTKRVLNDYEITEDYIEAEAGVPVPTLSKIASKNGYGGYEFLIGIPGSVGAGTAMNAGLTSKERKEIKDILINTTVIKQDGKIVTLNKNEIEFRYRGSKILDEGWYVLKSKFRLGKMVDSEEIRTKTLVHLKDRKSKQPLSKPTAGSTFKQPDGGKAAGWYIDKSGLKGYRVGNAMVSMKHANWIENKGNASSADVKQLIRHIITVVKEKFGITLEREVTYL
jgi:UDP-N-acetylmuramate dehydrogenase